jgi:hypothetical protein
MYRQAFIRISTVICLCTVFLGWRGVAFGSTVNWTFAGTITSGIPGSPYLQGRRYTAYFDIDTSLTTTTPSGLYYPITGYGFDVYFGTNSVVGFGASSTGSGVLIANDQATGGGGSFDGIIFSQFGEQSTGFPSGAAFDGSVDGITLANYSVGSTATPFTDTSFPSTLNLNNFSNRYLTEYFQDGTVRGSVNSLTINGVLVSAVPEPGPFSLIACGGCLCWGIANIRRKSGRG